MDLPLWFESGSIPLQRVRAVADETVTGESPLEDTSVPVGRGETSS